MEKDLTGKIEYSGEDTKSGEDFLSGSTGVYFESHLVEDITAEFQPQPDITAYELAQLLPFFFWRSFTRKDLESLGKAARYLKVLEPQNMFYGGRDK
jgi:hypothetical protein